MRVLFTGFTTLQCSPERRPGITQKLDVPALIADRLRALGHEVDWHKVSLGENLDRYDAAWINLAPPPSINVGKGCLGAMWALCSGLPAVGFLDDWQFPYTLRGAQNYVRHPERLYVRVGGKRLLFGETDETTKKYHDQLIAGFAAYMGPRWEAGLVPVCPTYSWGDKSIIQRRMPAYVNPISTLDPSVITKRHLLETGDLTSQPRERAWQMGSLAKHAEWLDRVRGRALWPVSAFGHRGAGGTRLATETDVCRRYAAAWGVLSQPYPHAGCGWWRSRFIYAAWVGSVLVADKGEAADLGPAYAPSLEEVEELTNDELAKLAGEQRAALFPKLGNLASLTDEVDRAITRAVREDKGWTWK